MAELWGLQLGLELEPRLSLEVVHRPSHPDHLEPSARTRQALSRGDPIDIDSTLFAAIAAVALGLGSAAGSLMATSAWFLLGDDGWRGRVGQILLVGDPGRWRRWAGGVLVASALPVSPPTSPAPTEPRGSTSRTDSAGRGPLSASRAPPVAPAAGRAPERVALAPSRALRRPTMRSLRGNSVPSSAPETAVEVAAYPVPTIVETPTGDYWPDETASRERDPDDETEEVEVSGDEPTHRLPGRRPMTDPGRRRSDSMLRDPKDPYELGYRWSRR